MSEPVTKRRPMIDLDEFERRLRQPSATSRMSDDDPLAELARLVGGQDDPYKAVFGTPPRGQSQSPRAAQVGAGGYRDPDGQPRLVSGDFAAIEAGLLGPREQGSAALPPGAFDADDFQDIDAIRAGHGASEGGEEASYPAESSGEDARSRRPLYLMAAIIIFGIAGIGASFLLKSGGTSPREIATIRAADGPAKVQVEAAGAAGGVARDASVLAKGQHPEVVGLVDTREQPVDLSQIEDKAPRVIALNGSEPGKAASGAAHVPVPLPPAQAPRAQDPSAGIAALIEPKKVKTVSVRPDGTLVPTVPPPQAADVPLPAPRPAVPVARPATPKVAERVATTPKPVGAPQPQPQPMAAVVPVNPAASAAKPAPAPAKGTYAVQLAAPESELEAREIQVRLMKKHGSDLTGFHPSIRKAAVGDKTVYRVRVGDLSREDAVALCQKMQSGGSACFVAKN